MTSVWGEFDWVLAMGIGFMVAWLIQHFRRRPNETFLEEQLALQEQERLERVEEIARLKERTRGLEETLMESQNVLEEMRQENRGMHGKLAAAGERAENDAKRLAEQKQEMESIHKKLTTEFENLANRVLDDKGKKFALQNKENLEKLLGPLGERIKDFRERVDKTHEEGLKDRAALKEQLKNLHALNKQMTEDAQNLTSALKGQSKAQGNWGEMILERVLEKSGLVKGREYEVQASLTDEEGRRLQPDVILNLPEDRHMIIDSKVSLVAYDRCVNEEDSAKSDRFLKEHIASIKTHAISLGKKSYDSLYSIKSPDFVLMFVPIEPAFNLAMQGDETLFDFAFQQNVVIVTPTNLLAISRTVANIWRQEKQTRNVMEIARRSGALYDKFVGFYSDMEAIGKQIGKSQEVYDAAMNKLRSGKGNLVKSVEDIKVLGAKAKRELPQDAIEDALLEE